MRFSDKIERWGMNMEATICNTDIFDYELKNKIINTITEELTNIDRSFMYQINVIFDKTLINDSRVEKFIIPEEELPKYLRGKELDNKEKIYQILSYQIKMADEALKENSIQIIRSAIIGRNLEKLNTIKVEIVKDKEIIDTAKKNKPTKVVSIMPNEEYTVNALTECIDKLMKQELETLSKAVGGTKILNEILSKEVSIQDINDVYKEFQDEYGQDWVESKDYSKELREKFLSRLRVISGEITTAKEIAVIKEKIVFKDKLLFELPIYNLNGKESGPVSSNGQYYKNLDQLSGHLKIIINGKDVLFDSYSLSDKGADDNCSIKNNINNINLGNYNFRVDTKDSNKIIISKMNTMLSEIEKVYSENGFYLKTEVYNNIINQIHLKKLFLL